MTVRLHANNFSTVTITTALTSGSTAMTLSSGTGLPTLAAGQFFNLTLTQGTTVEIVKVTAFSGASITTMVRAQEGTTAAAWPVGTVVALRETADSFDRKPDSPVTPVAYGVALWGTTAAGQMQSTSTSGTTGQVLISNGGSAIPSFQNPVEFVVPAQATSLTAVANTVYISTNASLNTFTLPTTPPIGTFVVVKGTTTGFWKILAPASTTIKYLATTTSAAGSLTCTSQYDSICVRYIATNIWSVDWASIGAAITVA